MSERTPDGLDKEFRTAEARAKQLRRITSLAVASLAAFSAAGIFKLTADLLEGRSDAATAEAAAIQMKNAALVREVARLQKQIDASKGTELPNANNDSSQQQVLSRLIATEERLRKLEAVILESPERALALPLIRKDIEEISRRSEETRAVTRADVDRLFDFQKWIAGGVATALIGIAGWALVKLFSSGGGGAARTTD